MLNDPNDRIIFGFGAIISIIAIVVMVVTIQRSAPVETPDLENFLDNGEVQEVVDVITDDTPALAEATPKEGTENTFEVALSMNSAFNALLDDVRTKGWVVTIANENDNDAQIIASKTDKNLEINFVVVEDLASEYTVNITEISAE